MFDFNFTACQPDLNSRKTKLNPGVRSARKAAATEEAKACLPQAPSIGEHAAGGQICPFPPVKRN